VEIQTGVRERRLIGGRVIIAAVVGVILLALLVTRLLWLQLGQHERFVTASENNRLTTLPVGPARGLILDQSGVVLADNAPRLQLMVVPEEVDDMDALLQRIQARVPLSEDEIERFQNDLDSRRRPREPVVLKASVSDAEAAQFAVDAHLFPATRLEARPTRYYPYGGLTAHNLGYVGRLTRDDVQDVDPVRYAGTEMIGKAGIELAYEEMLLGEVGVERVETSARGQIMRTVAREAPTPGANIDLHLDIGLQAKMYDILGERRGAVVALDPQTGGIKALVSAPSFDANVFSSGISNRAYQRLQTDPDAPLFNRALRGQYPPGSTIKPMLGLVGIDSEAVDWKREIFDRGFFTLAGVDHRYRDWRPEGHGYVDMEKAVIESCDTYFYDMSVRMGIDTMADGMAAFGFGRSQGTDIPGDVGGILPSREWKQRARNEAWYLGETVIAGIGQGYWVTTPLQLATATNVMATRGDFFEPHFATLQDVEQGERVELADSNDWERMIDAMEDVLHGERGTARRSGANLTYRIAGKTGTAQVFSVGQDEEYNADELDERLLDHALFLGFAPADTPELVVALIIENGGSGGSTAAPIARDIFNYWLIERESGRRDPDLGFVARVNDEVVRKTYVYDR
jgi:penicillin-binding protein 2